MGMVQFSLDDKGFPIFEGAAVANSGVTKTNPNSKGGNDAYDARSGKFAAKPDNVTEGKEVAETPENANPLEYKRMLDAARDAAREMDIPESGDIQEFLSGRAKDPGSVDIEGFLNLVKEQKLSDLVDIIDQQLRASGSVPSGKRKVRVVSPKGYVRRAFSALTDDGVAELIHRLEARGHSAEAAEDYVLGRKKEDVRESIKEKKNALAASDAFEPDTWWLSAADEDGIEWEAEEEGSLAVQLAAAFASMPAPVVNVTVPGPIS